MASTQAKLALFALSFIAPACGADLDKGMIAYKAGDYKTAIPLLRAAQQSSTDALRSAALLSALVYEGRVDESSEATEADAAAFPNSPEVIAARGEFAFYL